MRGAGRLVAVRFAAAFVLVAAASVPRVSDARVEETFTYPDDVVWTTLVRLLRVDLGYEISEQDRDNGYILFTAAQNGRTYNGSVQFVLGTGEWDTPVVELTLSVTGLAEGAEALIIRKLKTKLREDYGLPPRPERPAPPPEPEPESDDGTQAAESGGEQQAPAETPPEESD